MRSCHPVTSGSVSVARRRDLWGFLSHPSTLETVYLSWLAWPAWPCKWWCHHTDIEWGVKEPLRTSTNSPAATIFSVPILKYRLHIHAGHHGVVTVACDLGLRGLGYRSRLPWCGAVSLGMTLHLYVHCRDPGLNGYLVGL